MAKRQRRLDFEQLKHLAQAGAEATLHRLREEIAILERTFPELGSSKGRAKLAATTGTRAKTMSAAARKAVSARMKKYWRERKKAQTAGKK